MIGRAPSAWRLRRLAGAVILVAFAACGRFHPFGGSGPAAVIFSNQSLDQADVYAVVQGQSAVRIGTVMAGRTDTLTVPSDVTAPGAQVNIVARILARSIAPSTGAVSIYPGQSYTVTLSSDEKILSFLPAQ